MSELIGKIELRNCHNIWRDRADYRVDQVNYRREQVAYSYFIPNQAVEYLRAQLKGRYQVTKEDAATVLKSVAKQFDLPCTYGFKLDYYAQEILLVLVALGQGRVHKQGRGYFYTIY